MANDFISTLDSNTMLQLLKNEIGFKFEMPDILTFCDDDYYMGKLLYDKYKGKSRVYPYWREKLSQLYPNNLTTKSSYLVISGCFRGDTEILTDKGYKQFPIEIIFAQEGFQAGSAGRHRAESEKALPVEPYH